MKIKMTMFVMALCLCAGSYAYADPPDNKKSHEWQKQQYEMEQERQQKEREIYKDDRKYRDEDKGNYDRNREFGDRGDKGRYDVKKHRYFTDDHRTYIQDHYVNRYQKRYCPPGLAKKKNGCVPPGQAKKWAIGKPLPRQVVFYDLPRDVRDHLGPPPPHQRFIRVAQDILLISVGTGMVIDAIEDLNWQFNR